MKLPEKLPQVAKPFNPAYRETWEAMTPDERRWSFLFDLVIAGLVLFVAWSFS